ncbi:HNH/endonuclease VII fold putative polymorphic toxin [Melittangium boletus]|uniref:Rhs family protein n=1 Tax=Melittangium boletus DSM 14713 TaxID=1294270 RepID=A0A250I6I6_9BACT|nr:HNH/endonuclease VII fold putative polymorphic toxin [Melittangium boletus]ATB26793.1 rhs family protein [Melittangium boletus DSM 14713]
MSTIFKGAAIKLLQGGSRPGKPVSLKKAPVVNEQPPGRTGAFKKAKRDAGIPKRQQPERVDTEVPMMDKFGRTIKDKNGKPIMTREYHYKRADGKEIVIQDHSSGHQFGEPGGVGDQGPHLNVRPAIDTRNGKVPGTAAHYPFEK